MATINSVINKLNKFRSSYSKLQTEILDEVAEYTKNEIEKNYQSSQYEEESGDRNIMINKAEKSRTITVSGSQVLYTEFGTGTIGESHPHPEKSKYNLNPYNSGKTIRPNKKKDSTASKEGIPLNSLYWTYINKSGEKVYTQGIPAGMQVYRAVQNTKKKIKPITQRKVADLLSKL